MILNHRFKPNFLRCRKNALVKNIGGYGFGAADDVTRLKNKSFIFIPTIISPQKVKCFIGQFFC